MSISNEKYQLAKELYEIEKNVTKVSKALHINRGELARLFRLDGIDTSCRVPKEVVAQTKELLAAGLSLTQAALVTGHDRHVLLHILQKENFIWPGHREGIPVYDYDSEMGLAIVEEYTTTDSTLKDLSIKHKITPETVKRVLKHHNIPMKPSKYTCDTHYFDTIDTEEKAYWFGFLLADGAVSLSNGRYTLRLALKSTDKPHLQQFLKSLNSNVSIYDIDIVRSDKTYHSVAASINNKALVTALIQKGCIPNKSLILTFPDTSIIPKHLVHHFMRGYFDGDGCIHIAQNGELRFQIIGTKEFLVKYIENLNMPPKSKFSSQGKAFAAQYSTTASSKVFAFLYKNATVYLERKHDIYIKWLEHN